MSELIIARSLEHALEVLAGGEARLLAGGTDLMVALRRDRLAGREPPSLILDLSRVPELLRLEPEGQRPFIGAAVSFHRLESDPRLGRLYPLLARAAAAVGSLQVRHAGTLGGNAANASPAADGVCALTALGARALVASPAGEREMALEELITAPYRTCLAPDQIIVGFFLDRPGPAQGQVFLKVGRRRALAVARLNLALALDRELADPRVSLGSCFPTPRRLAVVEDLVRGAGKIDSELCQEAGRRAAAEFTAVCGQRHSSPYKLPAISALVARGLEMAWRGLGGAA